MKRQQMEQQKKRKNIISALQTIPSEKCMSGDLEKQKHRLKQKQNLQSNICLPMLQCSRKEKYNLKLVDVADDSR